MGLYSVRYRQKTRLGMDFMRNFFYRFQQFMYGRYGSDRFNFFLLILGLFLSMLSSFTRAYLLVFIPYIIYGYAIFRMLSKNHDARRKELYAFDKVWGPVRGFFSKAVRWCKFQKRKFDDRKTYRYFRCPNCRQQLRAPAGRGKIQVTCQKCHKEFIRKV